MYWKKLVCLFAFVSTVVASGFSQKITHGIVVDSVSLKALQGVHVRINGSERGTSTDSKGAFVIYAFPADTLVLSLVGYNTLALPLFMEEEDILIRLSERIRILKEVTIRGSRLYENEIIRTQRTQPQKMSAADGFSSPWEYFSKGQREKRKVVKLINENDRIKTYIQVINDQEIREDIMADHDLSELEYYSGLAKFNQQSDDVLYATDAIIIITELKSFFNKMYR